MSSVLGVSCQSYDLSYNLDEDTIFWPGGEGFQLCMSCSGDANSESFYSAGVFKCAEHAGTHVDAPYHFNYHGLTVDQFTLSNLIAYCHVIDISQKCINIDTSDSSNSGGNYTLQPGDIISHEENFGPILQGNIVLIRTGWSRYYTQGTLAYLGFDETLHGKYDVTTSVLRFPGIGLEAAQMLVERKVAAVGLDTASLDPGYSRDFAVHKLLLGANIYGIENINSQIDLLPPTGFTLLVMPLKFTGGSGSPARVTALVPLPVSV